MTAGAEAAPGGAVGGNPKAPPEDTGEALGLPASSLTLTFGFGPSLFDNRSACGPQAGRRSPDLPGVPAATSSTRPGPAATSASRPAPTTRRSPCTPSATSSGSASGRSRCAGRSSGSAARRRRRTSQATPRNLFGFKDGTRNLKAEDTDLLATTSGCARRRPPRAWMAGGSYLVARRIRMHIEVWDRTSLAEQENIIGRTRARAPRSARRRSSTSPTSRSRAPTASRRSPSTRTSGSRTRPDLGGVRILRRGYNFVDGSDGLGHLDAGLFFLAYMRDPQTQFVPMQRALAGKDAAHEYIEHTGSAVFACPPGLATGGTGARRSSPERAPDPHDHREAGRPGRSLTSAVADDVTVDLDAPGPVDSRDLLARLVVESG